MWPLILHQEEPTAESGINLTHREIADHLGIHYTTASKAFKRMAPHEK
jgi:DNA-binding transcriptional regulator YhcF (GntR family)